MGDLRSVIGSHPFLADLRPAHLDLVVGCAANRRAPEGEFLCTEGAEAREFYLIREGRVALECHLPHSGHITFETLESGEVLGWSWLLPPYRWHFDARVVSDARLLSFDVACLRQKMDSDPALGYALMTRFMPIVVKRLQAARLSLMDLYARPGGTVGGPHG